MPWPPRDSGYTSDSPGGYVGESSSVALNRLAQIGARFRERYMYQCWIENDADGFTGWRWDKHKATIMIVSAANRYKDIIVMGPRHYSNLMVTQCEAYGGVQLLKEYAGEEYEQGFVDQYGTFYNRTEAKIIAERNGQIRYPDACQGEHLFSEGLC